MQWGKGNTKTTPVEQPKDAIIPAAPQHQYDAMLIFAINKNGKVDILYDWNTINNNAAERYASLIYSVNDGQFENQMMQHLLTIKTNSTTNAFIKKIIDSWTKKVQDVRPAVRPMTVYKRVASQGDEG